jgi:hypothetical protein
MQIMHGGIIAGAWRIRVRFLYIKKSIPCRIFDYSGLGSSSFPCERISAQGAAAAHFVAQAPSPRLFFVTVNVFCYVVKCYYLCFLLCAEILYSSEVSPSKGVIAQSAPSPGLI